MTPPKAPENTTKTFDPLTFLAEAMVHGSGGAIERQEAQGQRSFVGSDTLPAKGDRTALIAAGVKFGDLVPNDSLFGFVELPQGWKKRPTDHSMWSELVDETGKVRATMFYKAASYDRDAFLSAPRTEDMADLPIPECK